MRKNLTLTLDGEVLKSARKVALQRDTSVNQLVREYLEQLVREDDHRRDALEDLRDFFRTSRYEIGRKKWTRDDLHDRR